MQYLSTDLHLYLASFLAYGDKISFGSCCLSLCHDLLFNHLRRVHASGQSELWKESHERLRERLAKYILSPDHQFYVTVTKNNSSKTFPSTNIYSLYVDYDQFTHSLIRTVKKIHRLELVIDSPHLFSDIILTDDYGIKSLIITNEITNVDEIEISLPVIPPPSSLEYLELNGPFSTISPVFVNAFVHLQELSLRGVESINNIHVRMFVNIPKIKLDTCENINDITPLQSNRDVSISTCRGIVDYRNAFTYSLRITIRSPNPKALIDLNCFKSVQNLTLFPWNSNSVTSKLSLTLKRLTIGTFFFYDNFAHLQEITVEFSDAVSDVQPFCCIPILTLADLRRVHSLNGLGYDEDRSKGLRNRKVVVRHFGSVNDFSPLNTIETVEILYCRNFCDLGQIKDVKNLTINCWGRIQPTVPMMCEKLTISGEITDNLFIYVPNAKELDISNLKGDKVRRWSGLKNLKNLERIKISKSLGALDKKGWKILLKEYFMFDIFPKTLEPKIIYVKKRKG